MELMRRSFAHHLFRRPFRWPPHARRDIRGCGERTTGFTPENRFGAGGKRGLRWSQRQAGLAVQPMFGLGFRLRWSVSAVDGLSVFGYGLAARARVLTVLARVLSVFMYVLTVFLLVLSVNLGESAQIGEFGKRHRRVFRHSLFNRCVARHRSFGYYSLIIPRKLRAKGL